ncbi:PREDICTED: photoreceptor-specific nuclear receptor-like [Ceratosolen solmsi marchali]|uniref:Photoreceptor-specific nuclear receptor-like n=1 Tax=Ceratosolen solmsi marchali TaxID=326594 RepID=A0AAJ6YWK8_9HYME|nr:PREDICTED: photoreceptor-specific nuclear receptor-like [Ceratosolen solmsi marchali]
MPQTCFDIDEADTQSSQIVQKLSNTSTRIINHEESKFSYGYRLETAAKLLFMIVQWMRDIIPFQNLLENDRRVLLEEAWTQLFLVHLAQWSKSWNLIEILEDEQVCKRLQDSAFYHELITIKRILHLFKELSPDESECGCMKAVVLFTPDLANLLAVETIEMIHSQAFYSFYDYTISRHSHVKFLGLIRLLFLLNHVNSKAIELLFFCDTIGQIPISHLLSNMYNTDQKLYCN